MYDYTGASEEELTFRKDDVLFVDNTRPPGRAGYWRAWLLDPQGMKLRHGLVISKNKSVPHDTAGTLWFCLMLVFQGFFSYLHAQFSLKAKKINLD